MIKSNLNHFVYSSNSDNITNLFMISPKYSEIMKKIQKRIINPKLPWYCIGKHLKVMFTTGPAMLNNSYIILPRKLFNPYSIVNGKLIIDKPEDIKEIYINTIDDSSTWNNFDTSFYNFVLKNRTIFVVLGIIFILTIIIGLIYYIVKYSKCKKSKDNCEKQCKI